MYFSVNGAWRDRTLDSTEFYDEASGEWRLGPPLPHPMRSISAIAKSETKVLLFGAMLMPNAFSIIEGIVNKLVEFDVSTGGWVSHGQ